MTAPCSKPITRSLTILLALATTGCQFGSGNVTTGDVNIVKQFIGCSEARSGVASSSNGNTSAGAEAGLTAAQAAAQAGSEFVGSLNAQDECLAVTPAPEKQEPTP